MNLSFAGADDKVWLRPAVTAEPVGKVFLPHHAKQGHECRVAFAEDDWTFSHDDEVRLSGGDFYAFELCGFVWKYAGK